MYLKQQRMVHKQCTCMFAIGYRITVHRADNKLDITYTLVNTITTTLCSIYISMNLFMSNFSGCQHLFVLQFHFWAHKHGGVSMKSGQTDQVMFVCVLSGSHQTDQVMFVCVLSGSHQTDQVMFVCVLSGSHQTDQVMFVCVLSGSHQTDQVMFVYVLSGSHQTDQVMFVCVLSGSHQTDQVMFVYVLSGSHQTDQIMFVYVLSVSHQTDQVMFGRVHIAIVVPEQYRYVGSAVYVNALCRQ